MKNLVTILLILVFSTNMFAQNHLPEIKEIDRDWTFRQANTDAWLTAEVPGTVHTDLLNNGKIEDPFYRINELDQQWIDKEDWEYQATFDLTPEFLGKKNIELNFDGLDTYADVYLNDSLILQADNMFREWRIPVKPLLKENGNQLRIYFHSPINKGLELLEKGKISYPASNDQSELGGLGDKKVSVFTRKAPYHYGWDWGPRLVTSGIWRPVYLKTWDDLKIADVFIRQPFVSQEKAQVEAEVSLTVNDPNELKIVVKDIDTDEILTTKVVQPGSGKEMIKLPFEIDHPKLWWANGLGEPHLYTFKIECFHGNQLVDQKEVRTGLRSIKLIRKPDEKGESFYFELNGVPVFAKGANYIPNDNFLPRVDRATYEKVVGDAAKANMNMIRIWGGGIYEYDTFYELCDKKGILIWQDFMFACSMYPGDSSFLTSVKQEAVDNVIRLRNHPCIALWCGNNEIEAAWQHDRPSGGWGWKQRFNEEEKEKLFSTYVEIFHHILPDVVEKYTDGDDYWPSSPSSGMGPNDHASYQKGDMHYWGVWHGKHRFEEFEDNVARFISEYGFQSFPEFESVKKYTVQSDWDIESKVMASHQRSGIGNLRIKEYMSWYYPVPESFEEFLYVGQLLQAYSTKTAIETHRRNMPYCMGTLYWQLNDCWPVASWSSTDYYRKWKAMHYEAKRGYEPIIVTARPDNEDYKFYSVSDELEDQPAILKIEVFDFDGNNHVQKSKEVVIKGNASTELFSVPIKELFSKRSEKNILIKMELIDGDTILAKNIYYPVFPKDQELKPVNIQMEIAGPDDHTLVIQTDKPARQIYLSVAGKNVFFEDNYFDLLPGERKELDFMSDENIDVEEIQVLTLNDIVTNSVLQSSDK